MNDINRLIAEKVMGYSYLGLDNGVPMFSRKEVYEGQIYDCLFRFTPSTNIAQAFEEVVAKMREKGWYLSLDQSMVPPYEWTASFFREDVHPTGLGAIGIDTPAQAICIASLAALEAVRGGE